MATKNEVQSELAYLQTLLETRGNSDVPRDCIPSYLTTAAAWLGTWRPNDSDVVEHIERAREAWIAERPDTAATIIEHARTIIGARF